MSSRRSTRLLAPVLLSAVLLGLAACGSDSDSSSSTAEVGATTPEQHVADAATVRAGLGNMSTTAQEIAATVAGGTKVSDAQDQLEVDWKEVEGVINQDEPDMYLQVEEDLGGIDRAAKDGDAAETTRFATDLASLIDTYLAKTPA